MDEDELTSVYNQKLIELSAEVDEPYKLPSPDLSAKAVSPICGSKISVEISLDGDKIADFGYELEACALTKSVVAIIKDRIKGKTLKDILKARKELEEMLSGKKTDLSKDWEALKILSPVIDYKPRHNSILLPFEAIEKAFKTVDTKESS